MPKLTAILARVSSPGQAKDTRHGIPNQLKAAREYAAKHELQVTGEYVDALSGTKETREAFSKLLAEADQYSAVIIYDLTRLARTEELGHRFLRLLRESGLEVHATTRGVVTDDFQTGVEVLLSAEERRSMFRRTQAGLIAQARRGLLPNGMHAYGYLNVPGQGKAIIEPKAAAVVKRIFELSAAGHGYRTIAKILNDEGVPSPKGHPWTHATPGRIIRNPTYKGQHEWKHKTGTYIIPVPAIVTPELWEEAQKKRTGPQASLGYPLSGHLRCGICGMAMSARKRKREYRYKDGRVADHLYYRYYRCNSRNTPGGSCGQGIPYAAKLERLVDAEVRALLSDPERMRGIRAARYEDKPVDDKRVAELKEQEKRLMEALRLGGLTPQEFTELRQELQAEMRGLMEPKEEGVADLSVYVEAARTMELKELLDFANVTVIYDRDAITVTAAL